jgi:exodeoxyribonuclease V alpha subunit
LTGQVTRIRYRDEDSGFVIIEINGSTQAKGEDPDQEILERRHYSFAGRWETAGRWGRQFKFDLVMLDAPTTRDGLLEFITDNTPFEYAQGVELWKQFAGLTIPTLIESPDRIAAVIKMDLDYVTSVSRAVKSMLDDEHAKLDLFRLLAGRGFSRKLTAKLVRAWGPAAAAKVRKDPLKLTTLFDVPLPRADKLHVDLGLPPDDLKRQALWAAYGAAAVDGSTWCQRKVCDDAIHNNCGRHHEGIAPDQAIRLAVRSGIMAERKLDGRDCVAVRRRADDERGIVARIRRLQATKATWPVPPANAGLSPHQLAELGKATAGPVGLFLGTPGTGKTYSAAALVRELLFRHGRELIAVCAPTGKAAVRCAIAMKLAGVEVEALTIHKLLGYRPQDEEFEHSRHLPLHHKFILVDESSMLDASLMYSLLDACSDGTQILFIGDPYQLPPVGHGAPLRDFAASGLPLGLLTEIRRNAGLIVESCARIKDGKPPTFADRLDLPSGANLRLVRATKPAESLERLVELLGRMKQRFDNDPKAEGSWDPVWQVQVLVAANKRSELSRKPVNDLLQKTLNPNAASAGHDFHVGDKIICLRNGQYSAVEPDRGNGFICTDAARWVPARDPKAAKVGGKKAAAEWYVANGEIGECLAIGPTAAIFQFEGNRAVKVHVAATYQGRDRDDDDQDRGRGCNFDLAYAITCHKSQGSGWPVVIILADEAAGMIASREWHYTAISRAEKICLVIGKSETVEKQIRRVALESRVTGLVELLKGE